MLAAGVAWLIECGLERIVERAKADLVARADRARRPEQMRAGTPFLFGDDRLEDPVDRGVETFHDRVMLVQA